MEVKKHYIVKLTKDKIVAYYKGYGNTTGRYEKAKMYTKFGNAKKGFDDINANPNWRDWKKEILYITTTIETIDDIAEKELLDLN